MTTHWSTTDIPDQSDRVAVVTGANSGLGYYVAAALAVAGAEVVLACRNTGKAQSAVTSIRRLAPVANVRFMPLDLADLASVATFPPTSGTSATGWTCWSTMLGLWPLTSLARSTGSRPSSGSTIWVTSR